jgi:hypothetical protein
MLAAGDAIEDYLSLKGIAQKTGGFGRHYRPRFPTNNHLETHVWSRLRGSIPRDTFRKVCDNLRYGFSALGDC